MIRSAILLLEMHVRTAPQKETSVKKAYQKFERSCHSGGAKTVI